MEVQFVASVSPIVKDINAARDFYGAALGLSFEGGEGDYVFSERLQGVKHFGLWPLAEAAKACFGTDDWARGRRGPPGEHRVRSERRRGRGR